MSENKKIIAFLVAIGIVLLFTFTLADYVNRMGQTKVPWLHQTDKDMIAELRMKLFNLNIALSNLASENRYLRKLVYTTKPDEWVTWVELLDECKRLIKIIEERDEKIKELEIKLGIRLWQMPTPYKEI